MTERVDPLAHLVPRDGLRDVDIVILDAFAVAGGSASRDQAFDLIERKLWGHMAGADKRQTFDDAVDHLLQQGALVPWGTERLPTLALPPRPYELPPRLPGGKPYIPGTEYWAGERQTLLSEVHRQLAVHLQYVEAIRAKFLEEFRPERTRLLELLKRQISRRQIDEQARNEAIVALSKLLLSPAEIASALDLSEIEVDVALNPKPAATRRSRRSNASPHIDSASSPPQNADLQTADADVQREAADWQSADAVAMARLIGLVRRQGGAIPYRIVGKYLHISGAQVESLVERYGERYPGCVEYTERTNGHGFSGYKTVIHAPPEEASA